MTPKQLSKLQRAIEQLGSLQPHWYSVQNFIFLDDLSKITQVNLEFLPKLNNN
jgi:hypothetical protein